MQQAVPEGTGAMYAIIGLDNEAIINACKQAEQGEVVSAVNFNSPGQVVIAGAKEAVERAAALCKEAGAKRALPLAVSVPSHCALMKPAADQLAVTLEGITLNAPATPVLNNVDVKAETESAEIRTALIRQLYSPVRWTETVEKMAQDGVEVLVEIGPGKVLTGLTSRIVKELSLVGYLCRNLCLRKKFPDPFKFCPFFLLCQHTAPPNPAVRTRTRYFASALSDPCFQSALSSWRPGRSAGFHADDPHFFPVWPADGPPPDRDLCRP